MQVRQPMMAAAFFLLFFFRLVRFRCSYRRLDAYSLAIRRPRVAPVSFGVVPRSIAVIGKGRHDKVALHPVSIPPCRSLTEPDFIIDPIGLQHIARCGHIEIEQLTALVKGRFMVLGILNRLINPLEHLEREGLGRRVRVIERIEDKSYAHRGTPLADALLLHEVADIGIVDEYGGERHLVLGCRRV